MKLKQKYVLTCKEGERLKAIQEEMNQEVNKGLNDPDYARKALNVLDYLVDELKDILVDE